MQKIVIKKLKYILDSGETLFDNISFTLHKGDKVGVIGRNGSGKTTLLKLLFDEVNLKIYYVPQQKDVSEEETRNLSGGEFIRYHLIKAKKYSPEILLLDEPTNHLDDKGREILQEYINTFDGIIIFVSHDEDFLKQNAKKIFSIWNKTLEVFGGSYSEWEVYRKKFFEGIKRRKTALKKEEKKLKIAKQIELERHQRIVQKNRSLRYDNSMGALEKGFFKDSAQFAHGKIKSQVERLQESNTKKLLEYELPQNLDVSFIFPGTNNKKSLLLKVDHENLVVNTKTLIQDFDFEIYHGEKILLSGDNGSGKSVLANSLIRRASTEIKIAFLDQFYNSVEKSKTLLENVLESAPTIEIARKVLSLYGFPDTHIINQKANNLSGGEMCRLALAKISISPLDLIILDEPTNNIDIETKEVLVLSLEKFSGAILVISHDKEFVKKLKITKTYKIENKKLYSTHENKQSLA
jgi:ATPase subunit of ABC transporter with duplicated ATPase domains